MNCRAITLQFPSHDRRYHRKGLILLENHLMMRASKLPIHGEGRFRPVRFDDAVERSNAVLGHIGRTSDMQIHSRRSTKNIIHMKREYAFAKMARCNSAPFVRGVFDFNLVKPCAALP